VSSRWTTNPARPDTGEGKARVRHHAAVIEDAGKGSARTPRELARGCLGEFFGELALYAALAILAGLLVLCVRGVDVLLRRNPIVGGAVLTAVAVGFLYGLVWTVRLRPGLYLEHLKGDPGPSGEARNGAPDGPRGGDDLHADRVSGRRRLRRDLGRLVLGPSRAEQERQLRAVRLPNEVERS
jgi:hypothetical protein